MVKKIGHAVENGDDRFRVHAAENGVVDGVASDFGAVKFLGKFSGICHDLLEN